LCDLLGWLVVLLVALGRGTEMQNATLADQNGAIVSA